MIKFALKHGTAVAVVVIIVAIFGVLSLFRVPVQMTPDLTPTSVSVITNWAGATPQDIEKELIIEQEDYLRNLPDLEKITSTATTGRAEIVLDFRLGVGLEEILVRVNNALSQVPSYPENVDQPRIVTSSASDEPIAWFSLRPLEGNPKNLDIVAIQDYAEDNIKTAFERTPGISQAQIFGGAPRQIRVYIDPAELAERNITVQELRGAMRGRNRDVSGGDFDDGKRRYLIRTIGRFDSVSAIENTLIARREGANIRLKDVGYAELDRAETRAQVRHNGERALAMNARRQPGTNIIQVMNDLQDTVAELNEGALAEKGLILRQVSDDTIYIRDAVTLVRNNLILGGILATIMLLLFLRSVPATLIGAMAVPICTVAAFLGLTIAGRTINVISLAGVAFAIGMTVDASIVVLENIYRHKTELGKGAIRAAYDGVSEVWGAVLASATTTVFVFLPIVFVEEEAGQLFADIAIAISAAIMCALLVAVLVIPAASARLLGDISHQPKNRLARHAHNLFGIVPLANQFRDAVMFAVRWLMKGVLRRIVLVAGMFSFAIFVAIALVPQTEYLPEGQKNLLFGFMFPPPGYNIQEMTEIGREIEAEFLPYVNADPAEFDEGRTDVPAIQEFFFVNTTSFLLVITKTEDPKHLDALVPHIMGRLNKVPGMLAFATRPSIFSGDLFGSRGLDIDITGPQLPEIFETAGEAFGRTMGAFPDPPSIRPDPPSLSLGQPMLEIRPDWERAAELGVNTQELGYLVWALTDGAYMDEFFLGDDKIDMFLYSTQGTVNRTEDLNNLLLYSNTGNVVPLSTIASVRSSVSTETIRRIDGARTVTLQVKPPIQIPLEEAVRTVRQDVIEAMTEQGAVPPGVTMRIAGASDKLEETRQALGGNFVLAVAIAYLLMVALFSHWGYPLIIMTSVPLGIVGGIVGLWLMNHTDTLLGWLGAPDIFQPLDVITMLGFIILVGTVVNNPILIVEQALLNMREGGMNALDAVIESTRTRIRPIMMSTMTTSLGLSPLVFIPGAGAELYRGLGTVVLFGLFFSTLFTLTFTPSLLSLFLQLGEKVRRKPIHEHRGLDVEEALAAPIDAAAGNGHSIPSKTSDDSEAQPQREESPLPVGRDK